MKPMEKRWVRFILLRWVYRRPTHSGAIGLKGDASKAMSSGTPRYTRKMKLFRA